MAISAQACFSFLMKPMPDLISCSERNILDKEFSSNLLYVRELFTCILVTDFLSRKHFFHSEQRNNFLKILVYQMLAYVRKHIKHILTR